MTATSPLLVLDTGSPLVSLALGRPGELIDAVTVELRQSSERLLVSLTELLQRSGWHLADVAGVLTLRGPGSFTGLRIGLATTLGLHQALELPVAGLETLPILAMGAADRVPAGHHVIAAVDALRGQWMAQAFVLTGGAAQAVDAARLQSLDELRDAGWPVISFSAGRLESSGFDASMLLAAPPLAQVVIERVLPARPQIIWDPASLVQPIYFRPPAAKIPRRPSSPPSPSHPPSPPHPTSP